MTMIQRIILSGGGTGGHIYPALSIYRRLKEMNPDLECLYIGTERGLEARIVPQSGIPFESIEIQGLKRSLSLSNFKALWLMLTASQRAKKMIQKFQPDVIVGTGGYACAPVVSAGADLGIPTLIHEQNSVAGLTNKFLARKVDRIATSFKAVHHDFAKYAEKIRFTGNPRAQEVYQIKRDRQILASQFKLKPDQATVLIFGGSRGAPAINQAALAALTDWSAKDYQVIIATGQDHYQALMDEIQTEHIGKNIRIVPYIENMPEVFQAIDLVICRSGATTLTEIMALSLASILIPSPYVTNNHQEANAQALVDQNAAIMIKQDQLNPQILVSQVDQLIQDPEKLKTMGSQARSMAVVDATDQIIQQLSEIVG
ncbi:undecaprenyldiphospho-muramoylpentapeptide beta-N-acetylglucosaminyltransferase [Ignavigranum ruoffiae]|uniref:undecaprenyldiphospho-muramoylpentapeptide beta-N-acetylglucosaminyltransferase n=1 Tax=Ignavigranum ruoffiae TaxID=89093 RepID=UPI0024AD32BC|nr:undecaprenyldiphospho-muramoylpentapeptide beta-N-acetylglucosaminyltransferase [Ignavigranum ruoffiae]